MFSCVLNFTDRGPGFWKLNTEVLSDRLYIRDIETFWAFWRLKRNQHPLDVWWDMGKERLKAISVRHSKRRAREIRCRQTVLESEISRIEDLDDPNQDELESLRTELYSLNLTRSFGAQVRSGQKLAEDFEVPNQYFFKAEKAAQYKRTIKTVLVTDERGNKVEESDPNKVSEHIVGFYRNLYSPAQYSERRADEFLNKTHSVFPDDQADALTAPIIVADAKYALIKTEQGKSPGLDGLPYEFYTAFWDTLGEDLVSVYNYSLFDRECLPKTQYQAVVSLLAKDGDLRDIRNWRPISLTNCDYKILTKTLANRLADAMPHLVAKTQVCSVKGRQIQHHTLLIRELITHCNRQKATAYILSVDQEKAFDKVGRRYMLKALRKLGLPERFVNFVETLYRHAKSSINVNGHLSDWFLILRGVRQGCPLSLLLHVLVAESLGNAIRANPNITSIRPP